MEPKGVGWLVKFSEIGQNEWNKLKPYMDTCLLPLTGLTGREAPWEATAKLEHLKAIMTGVEQKFVGRVVTYPAWQYQSANWEQDVAHTVEQLRSAGFRYIVVATVAPVGAGFAGADLVMTPETAREAEQRIAELWWKDGSHSD